MTWRGRATDRSSGGSISSKTWLEHLYSTWQHVIGSASQLLWRWQVSDNGQETNQTLRARQNLFFLPLGFRFFFLFLFLFLFFLLSFFSFFSLSFLSVFLYLGKSISSYCVHNLPLTLFTGLNKKLFCLLLSDCILHHVVAIVVLQSTLSAV